MLAKQVRNIVLYIALTLFSLFCASKHFFALLLASFYSYLLTFKRRHIAERDVKDPASDCVNEHVGAMRTSLYHINITPKTTLSLNVPFYLVVILCFSEQFDLVCVVAP